MSEQMQLLLRLMKLWDEDNVEFIETVISAVRRSQPKNSEWWAEFDRLNNDHELILSLIEQYACLYIDSDEEGEG